MILRLAVEWFGRLVGRRWVQEETRMLRTVIRRETSGRLLTFWDYNELGIHFFDHRAYDLAVAAFKRAVDAAVFPLAALDINLGAAYLARGMGALARTWLEKGLSIEPDNQKGRCLLAHTFKQAGLASEALAELKRAYALDPGSPEGRGAEQEIARLPSGVAG